MDNSIVTTLRRQLTQQLADVDASLKRAQTYGDRDGIQFFGGKRVAYRTILETIEVAELEPADERRRAS